MAPQFEKAAGQLEPQVRFAKVNTDDEQQLAGRFGIQGIPTMILFHRGKEIARQSGLMDATPASGRSGAEQSPVTLAGARPRPPGRRGLPRHCAHGQAG